MDRTITMRIITADLPETVNGACTQTGENKFLVTINGIKTDQRQAAAFLHECLHIWHDDFSAGGSIDKIEAHRHREIIDLLQLLRSDDE